ncbi:hypothetical protein HHI36_005653 [Cryptolaemus montrouzieri]|uniref:Protein brambleberry n=1 Tax=Cryptolaemus montrouzieri TaxID=559131 RepID=A0ABD2NWD0_9CUCU
MFQLKFSYLLIVILFGKCGETHGGLHNYIKDIGKYFGYSLSENSGEEYNLNIPYEVSTMDEKFISEAAKLTGVALSELDSCQQKVILKLKTDCHKLNDEQLAKLAVHLLNCQSYIEGRQTYPCTEDMSIKDCTTKMDSDTWTIYHLMSNRARAVCYMIRQTQFRGLAENTVNRLMDAAKHQIHTLDKISLNQENLQNMAEQTYDSLSKGHAVLSQQQKNLLTAQFHGQLKIEDNIARLIDEKKIIAETHNKLLTLTKDLQDKLENSGSQLKIQNSESKLNHQELIRDLVTIQEQTQEIFRKIEDSSELLLLQSREFKSQYEYTMKNLMEVNRTVHSLVSLVGGTRKALEDRLEWVSNALGGTDSAVERLYLILWHIAFLLSGMLGCAFLSVQIGTRLIVTFVPSLNLAIGLYENNHYLNPIYLLASMGCLIMVQEIIIWITSYQRSKTKNLPMIKERGEKRDTNMHYSSNIFPENTRFNQTSEVDVTSTDNFSTPPIEFERKISREYNDFGTPTPPLSRSGFYIPRSRSNTPNLLGGKGSCHAKTRTGTSCKLSCLPGRDFCYRHQSGDSISKG